jgi:hypothetical protein
MERDRPSFMRRQADFLGIVFVGLMFIFVGVAFHRLWPLTFGLVMTALGGIPWFVRRVRFAAADHLQRVKREEQPKVFE